MADVQKLFDRTLLAKRRQRAAARGAAPDFLLAHVAQDIVERLAPVMRRFPLALDLGGAHGLISRVLLASGGVDDVMTTDLASAALSHGAGRRVACDEERLPFAPASFDLVVSGLALHWVNDLPGALIQIRQSLKPDGLFLGTVLGGETLTELSRAFMESEAEMAGGASPRVGPFADVRAYGALLQRAGFAMPVADTERLTVNYATPFDLLAELRAMGAANVLGERSRKPLGRTALRRMAEIYVERYANNEGRVPATFDFITLTAWAPGDGQPKPLAPGSAQTRLADALGVDENSAGEKAQPSDPKFTGRR